MNEPKSFSLTFDAYFKSFRDFVMAYVSLREKLVKADLTQLPTDSERDIFFLGWLYLREHKSELNTIPIRNAFKDIEADIPVLFEALAVGDLMHRDGQLSHRCVLTRIRK